MNRLINRRIAKGSVLFNETLLRPEIAS